MKRSAIKRTKSLGQYLAAKQVRQKPIPKVSKKNVTRVGKLGIVRLRNKDLAALRLACFERDGYHCRDCGRAVSLYGIGPEGVPLSFPQGQMAHIHAKRNGGDTLDNVRTLCPNCHRNEHNAGGKPCPPKGGL